MTVLAIFDVGASLAAFVAVLVFLRRIAGDSRASRILLAELCTHFRDVRAYRAVVAKGGDDDETEAIGARARARAHRGDERV